MLLANAAIKMTNDILHKLQERIKELTALHATARILQDQSKSPSQVVSEIAMLLPPAWQYPGISVARSQFENIAHATPNFKTTEWGQRASFSAKEGKQGSIELFYLEPRPLSDEGPFLREERDLIESLADMLGSYFQRREADEELKALLGSLEEQVKSRTRELREANSALNAQIDAFRNAQRRIESYQEKLRRLTSELSLTEARERRAIAEDLHDHIGQALAFIKMNVSSFRGNAIFCGFESNIDRIVTLLDQTIKYTRDLTFEISPPVLYELGLVATLEWLADRFRQRHAIDITVQKSDGDCDIGDDYRVTIFKSVQELLTNSVKHSGADKITISIGHSDGRLQIGVIDNGKGFDTGILESSTPDMSRFGLFNVRERLEYLGGDLEIASASGKGTIVTLSIPFSGEGKNGDTHNHSR